MEKRWRWMTTSKAKECAECHGGTEEIYIQEIGKRDLCLDCLTQITLEGKDDYIAELEAQVAELKTIIGSTAKGHDALCTCACCVEVDRVYNEAKPKGDQPSDKSDIPWRYRSQGKGR